MHAEGDSMFGLMPDSEMGNSMSPMEKSLKESSIFKKKWTPTYDPNKGPYGGFTYSPISPNHPSDFQYWYNSCLNDYASSQPQEIDLGAGHWK